MTPINACVFHLRWKLVPWVANFFARNRGFSLVWSKCAFSCDASTLQVWVNQYNVLNNNVPFGGKKQSGIGMSYFRTFFPVTALGQSFLPYILISRKMLQAENLVAMRLKSILLWKQFIGISERNSTGLCNNSKDKLKFRAHRFVLVWCETDLHVFDVEICIVTVYSKLDLKSQVSCTKLKWHKAQEKYVSESIIDWIVNAVDRSSPGCRGIVWNLYKIIYQDYIN